MFRPIQKMALGLALTTLVGAASAQCLTPDNLTGPCWGPTQATLPPFPATTLPGTGICWDNCTPQPMVCTQVGLAAPVMQECGRYLTSLRVDDCAGNSLLNGRVWLDYTRTWDEMAPNNVRLQVWRFTAKVDMMRGNAVNPCVVPPELAPAGATTFYYGYVDYAFDCQNGSWQSSLVLFHNCDQFIHQPGLSSTPGVFHPGRSYAIVAPHTALNPFAPANLLPPVGPIVSEAVRSVPQLPGQPCQFEEPVQGQIGFLGQGCGCTFNLLPKQVTARRFLGQGSCPSPVGPSLFLSVNASPGLPWIEVMTTSIGNWTTPLTYPGQELAWVDEGPFAYFDSCVGAAGLPGGLFAEMFYGATTDKGYPVIPPAGAILSQRFTDLASNNSYALPGPITLPLVGAVRPTRHLIYVNVP